MTRAWVEIDLGALLRNGRRIAEHTGVPLLPMVKADAYGLGAVRVARALETLDPWGFGVATVAEGDELRRAGIARPIVVFTPLLVTELDAACRSRLTPALGDRAVIQRWAESGLPWQLAVDTGMSRAGVPWDAVAALREQLLAAPPEGVFTHFHSAQLDDGSRERQEDRFALAIADLPARPPLVHTENSAAIVWRGRESPWHWSLTRPGIFLYGVGCEREGGARPAIAPDPVVSLRARVVDLRTIAAGEVVSYDGTFRAKDERRIATLALGYADGYRRALSNRGVALMRGKRVPVAGVVTMDMTMLDVTGVRCEIGDLATLIGSDGSESITVADAAAAGGLSPYELLTGLRLRLPRRYTGCDPAE